MNGKVDVLLLHLLCHTPKKIKLPVDLGPFKMRSTNRSSKSGSVSLLSCRLCGNLGNLHVRNVSEDRTHGLWRDRFAGFYKYGKVQQSSARKRKR